MNGTDSRNELPGEVQSLLAEGVTDRSLQTVLDRVLAGFACETGTVHTLDPATGLLTIRAHTGVPEALLERVRRIPIGKGMAGLAAERREPVRVCNLQSDESGAAKAGAKLTGMEGCISVPMLDGDTLRGVLGIAKATAYDFTEAEVRLLLRVGALIARHTGGGAREERAA